MKGIEWMGNAWRFLRMGPWARNRIAHLERRLELARGDADRVRECLRAQADSADRICREFAGDQDRRMKWFDALRQIREVHDRQGQTLASLLEAHALVGCRLDALSEEICPLTGGKAMEGNKGGDPINPVDRGGGAPP